MNKLLAVIAAVALLGGVASFAYRAGENNVTANLSTASSDTSTTVPADPTLDAECTSQPNLAPTCTQGNYNVSLTIGAKCYDPSYEQPEEWLWTNGSGESGTVRCMTVR